MWEISFLSVKLLKFGGLFVTEGNLMLSFRLILGGPTYKEKRKQVSASNETTIGCARRLHLNNWAWKASLCLGPGGEEGEIIIIIIIS